MGASLPPTEHGGGGPPREVAKKKIEKKTVARIFELAIGTLKIIESGACDLPPEDSKKSSLIDLSKF